MKAYADEYDELGGLLGDDHDLAVLAVALTGEAPPPPSVDLPELLELIAAAPGSAAAAGVRLGPPRVRREAEGVPAPPRRLSRRRR